jgi:hypothetical protein
MKFQIHCLSNANHRVTRRKTENAIALLPLTKVMMSLGWMLMVHAKVYPGHFPKSTAMKTILPFSMQ